MPLYGNTSKLIQDKVVEKLKNAPSNICRIETKIYSDSNPELVVKPIVIRSFNVVHDFSKSYHEKVTATFEVFKDEAVYILANSQDLRATIVMNHIRQNYYTVVLGTEPDIRQYRVFLLGKDDLKKTLQKVEFMEQMKTAEGEFVYTPDEIRAMKFNLQVELMDEKVYEFGKRPVNGILKDVTMQDTVHFMANALNIKNVDMVTPDNDKKYNHVILNPMVTLEVIDKLQNTYGIYQKGIAYFYHSDTLFIYPEYETKPQTLSELHIWKLPKDSYSGLASYSREEEDVLTIFTNEDVGFMSLSEVGTEQNGNFQITRRADTTIDLDTQQLGKEAQVNANNMFSVSSENEKTVTQGKVSARYNGVTSNPLALSSAMASVMCGMMVFRWNMAWPWSIKPGCKVVYYYEELSGIRTAQGIVDSVEYALAKIDGIETDAAIIRYAWAAAIVVRLEVVQDEEEVTLDMLSPTAKKRMEQNAAS